MMSHMHHGLRLFYVHAETGNTKIVMAQDMRLLSPSTSVNNESHNAENVGAVRHFSDLKEGYKKSGSLIGGIS